MSVQHLTLYAEDFRVPPVLHVVQNDTGRTVEFLIADYEVPAGAGAWLWMEIPGTENKVILAGTVSGQKVTVDLTGASLAVAGKSDCMVQITSGGEFVKTFAFVTDIHETVGGETVTPEEEELFEDLMAGVDDKFADYEDEIDEDLTRMQNQLDEFIGAQGEHNETTLWSGTAYLVDAAITLDYVPDDYQEIKIYASGEWHSYKTSAFIDNVNGVTIKKSTLHSNGTPANFHHAELSIKASYDHSDANTTDEQKKAFTIYRHRVLAWSGDDAADASQTSVDQNFDTSQSDQVTLVEIRGVSNNANAEVADARVGYDGTTYASLGAAIRSQVEEAMAQGIDDSVKQALLNCFNHVAWIDADGQDYVDALEDALYPDAELTSISAVFDPVSSVSLSGLSKIGGYFTFDNTVTTATWVSSANSYSIAIPTIVGDKYTIELSNTDSGTVGTIFRAGFSSSNVPSGQHISGLVSTTPQDDSEIELTATDSYLIIQFSNAYGDSILSNGYLSITQTNLVYKQDSLDSLKPDLVVTGHWSNGTTTTISTYTLSGTLSVGTSAVTVTYQGKTTTFNVTVINPYQYVEYIENPSDANSWIELNVVPSNTFGFKATVALAERSGDVFVFGTREVANGRIILGINGSTVRPYLGWGSGSSASNPTVSWDASFVAELNYKNSRTGKVNNTTVFQNALEALSFTPTWNYIVLGSKSTSGVASGKQQKLYAMEITVGSLVVMNLKPCYRTSDNAIGLYDELNGIFYGNSGTGNLSKGADVNG